MSCHFLLVSRVLAFHSIISNVDRDCAWMGCVYRLSRPLLEPFLMYLVHVAGYHSRAAL